MTTRQLWPPEGVDNEALVFLEDRRRRLAGEFDRVRAFGYGSDDIDPNLPNPFRAPDPSVHELIEQNSR